MKLKPDTVMTINLLFRIFLIMYLLKEYDLDKTKKVKPLKYWMDPISKRVFLIFINGLQADFIVHNSTPYLKQTIENYGSFGIALTGYLQTNEQGLRTILTGRYNPPFPYSLFTVPYKDTILNYAPYKCAIGSIPKDLSIPCYFPDDSPLENFQKFPKLFTPKKYKSSLYIMSLDLDPIWVKDYPARLKRIDDDIRFFASMIDSVFADNKTTYIVTSARGSPVGKSLSIHAPVLAWGSGIANNEEVTYMWQSDLTAMLCALLGINYPSGLFGVIPMSMMYLHEFYEFELTLYAVRHFEKVLEVVDIKNYLIESSELELEQVITRLHHIVFEVRRARMMKMLFNSFFLLVLLTLWGFNLILVSATGVIYVFFYLKSLFLLLLATGITITYTRFEPELPVLSEIGFFLICQNFSQVYKCLWKHCSVIGAAVLLSFIAVTLSGVFGNYILVPTLLIPVILWPVINGSYRRLNRYVLFTRLLSGIAVGVLPLIRVYGEVPDRFFISSSSLLFLINFYALMRIFKRKFDAYINLNFLVIFATNFYIIFHSLNETWSNDVLSCLLLAFSFLCLCFASGTLLSRLLKVFLSLFIPVLLLSVKVECVFYFTVVFHLFTWIFIEYHNTTATEMQLYPSIFSIEAKTLLKSIQFSFEDFRHIGFFIFYCYVFYFAIGHNPELHSYDLYVMPAYMYSYPKVISYFFGAFKFFLPFFLVTLSFITICVLKEKDFDTIMTLSVWLSDVIGCSIVFYSQFFNLVLEYSVFPIKFSYFIIQQFATVSMILSYFLGKSLLLGSKTFSSFFHNSKQQNI